MSITVTHVNGPETGSPNKQLHQSDISIPLPAVLGRGALLKCAEKKVSRRHATLDWEDDGVIINSVNQNPTFVTVSGKRQKLSQGESVVLCHGDKFGLLEEAFWFRITLENGTQSSDKENALMNNIIEPRSGHDNIKELKCIQENKNDYSNHNNKIIKNKETNLEESNVEENEIIASKKDEANKVAKGETVSEYIQKNFPLIKSDFPPKDQLNATVETSNEFMKTETKINTSYQAASSSKQLFSVINQDATTSNEKEVKVSQISCTQKDLEAAVNDRKRTLPAWMMGSASAANKIKASTSNKKEANAVQHGRKNVKATQKKQNTSNVKVDISINNNVDNVEIKGIRNKSPQKTPSKTTSSKYHGMSQNDDEIIGGNLIAEKEEKLEKKKSPLKRSPKTSPSKKTPSKYHGLSQEFSEEETSDKEDIEMKNSTTENGHDISDDGSDGNTSSPIKNLPSPRKLKTSDKKSPSTDNDDSGSKETNKTKNTIGNRLAGVTSTDDAGGRGQKRAAPRGSCAYGSQCYRKNPQHKDEYAHPGDSDYNEDDDDDDDDGDGVGDGDDDERPECEFGVDCYRKNPQHKKQFKHTRLPQPQRKAKRKAKAKKGSDDSESDDYDYDDPFLNDDSSDDYAPTDSGSDTNMEDNDDEEDTDRMLKEGKKFIKKN